MMKKTISYLSIVSLLFVLFSFTFLQQPKSSKKWDVPAEYVNMKNPVKKNDQSLALGKSSFNRNCAGCHGVTGKGDGDKLKNLVNLVPANLSLNKVTSETDGEHFYKIKIGRENLHTFKGKVDDEAIWSIVIYMKTFSAK
jgi:mono/diheme cytochrome c family protein